MSELTSGIGQQEQIDTKIIPVMREAVTMVQMILYRQLEQNVRHRRDKLSAEEHRKLAGAVVNNLFGTMPEDKEVIVFGGENRKMVEAELRNLAEHFPKLRPFLTDALRMKTICDNQEGIHSIPSLLMAKELGILQEERALPMPSTFMLSVRNLAANEGLVKPMQAAPPPEEPQA